MRELFSKPLTALPLYKQAIGRKNSRCIIARPACIPGQQGFVDMKTSSHEMTRLLVAWGEGDAEALHMLLPLVHQELQRLAHRYMSRESAGHTLETSALVNEAYLRLVDQKQVRWQNRAH